MWRKEDIVKKLKEKQGGQSLRSFAANHVGCSAAYLSRVYNGVQNPGPRLLNTIGVKKQVKTIKTITYTKKDGEEKNE